MLERVYGKLSAEELGRRLLLHVRAALPDCIANSSVGTEIDGISRQAGRAGMANAAELVGTFVKHPSRPVKAGTPKHDHARSARFSMASLGTRPNSLRLLETSVSFRATAWNAPPRPVPSAGSSRGAMTPVDRYWASPICSMNSPLSQTILRPSPVYQTWRSKCLFAISRNTRAAGATRPPLGCTA